MKRESDKEHYRHIDRIYKTHLYYNKKSLINNLLDNSRNRSCSLYNILGSFAKPENNNYLPDISKEILPDEFAVYFVNMIEKIREHFKGKEKCLPPIRPCSKVLDFKSLTEEQVPSLIQNMNYTTCSMDPCDTKFLMKVKHTLLKTITKIIIISLTTGQYLDEYKIAVVRPFVKRPKLDTEYKNYCLIRNLSFISKMN